MLASKSEKRLLQIIVALACMVPVSAGLAGMLHGVGFLLMGHGALDLDSHMRYLSGLLLGIGIGFLTAVPRIERYSGRFRLLTMIVMTGGIGRLAGFYISGLPDKSMQVALVMELAVTPLLCLWQHRVARRLA